MQMETWFLIVEEEKSVFNIIRYFGLLGPTSPCDTILRDDAGVWSLLQTRKGSVQLISSMAQGADTGNKG